MRPDFLRSQALRLCLALAVLGAALGVGVARAQEPTLTLADARHLLERTGLGAAPREVAQVLGRTRSQAAQWVMQRLDGAPTLPYPAWVQQTVPPYWARWDYEETGRQAFRVARDAEIQQLKLWWVREMIETPRPQHERLVLFWHNLLVSSYSGVNEESHAIAQQHQLFRRLAAGNFKALIHAVVRDAAMLNYLDNENSRRQAPNENLARELMELFTLGEGAYDERTVKEAARALTGYSVNRLQGLRFEFKEWDHDKGSKRLWGNGRNADGDGLVDAIFERPEAASYLARRFWRAFVSEVQVDEAEVQRWAAVFRRSGFEVKALYRAMLDSPAFWAPEHRGAVVKSPVDLVLGSIRSTGFVPSDWATLPAQLSQLGQHLFEPPNVAGWPGGSAWITPSHLLNRARSMQHFFDSQGEGARLLREQGRESMLGTPENLVLRYAAEDFQGPPRFHVRLLDGEREAWRSASLAAQGGVDTAVFGRARESTLPWQYLRLDLPPGLRFDSATVSFENDHCCGPAGAESGDRNFFVDWLKAGPLFFPAALGEQFTSCPPQAPGRAGSLHCSGPLRLRQSARLFDRAPAERHAPPPGQVQAERVVWEWFNPGGNGQDMATINLGLLNARIEDQGWDALGVELKFSPQGRAELVLIDTRCAPDCLGGDFPAGAERWGQRRALKFPLPSTGWNEMRFFQALSPQQQRWVSALWMSVPQLLEAAQAGRRYREQGMEQRLAPHRAALDKALGTLPESVYAQQIKSMGTPGLRLAAAPEGPNMGAMMGMALSDAQASPPQPLGEAPLLQASDWSALWAQALPQTPVDQAAALFLPWLPAPRSGADGVPLQRWMQDPAYQLK